MSDSGFTARTRLDPLEQALGQAQRMLPHDAAGALRAAEELVQRHQDPRVYRLAADACRRLGREADAAGAELGAIQAALPDPKLRQSAEAQADGRNAESRRIADEFLAREPDDLLALTLSAEASVSLWDLDRAERDLRSILARAPTFLRASLLLADTLTKQLEARQAIEVLEPVLQRKPGNQPALTHMARLRSEVGAIDEAVALNERLIELDDRVERWVNLGHLYRIAGRRDDAIGALRRAIGMDPYNGSAWWTLANYFLAEVDGADESAIRRALPERSGHPEEGALRLALGLIADRAQSYDAAFDHFLTGKAIRLRHQPYEPDLVSAAVDGVIELFTADFFAERQRFGYDDPAPIFVVGLPRSGTTLLERVLAGHSQIEGTGELQVVPRLAEIARQKAGPSDNYADLLRALGASELSDMGRRYLAASHDYRRSAKPRFIDKNNLNWLQAGLILLMLPGARIIDVRRDPVDCCWANFKMLFAEGYPAANDLRHIGRFYSDYVRSIEALKAAAPGRILTVRYEDVVDDIAGQTRSTLDFLGLDFEPQCIDFHRATGPVATASSEQVRRPLNREGIGSSAPYRAWLGPMIDELGPLVHDGSRSR